MLIVCYQNDKNILCFKSTTAAVAFHLSRVLIAKTIVFTKTMRIQLENHKLDRPGFIIVFYLMEKLLFVNCNETQTFVKRDSGIAGLG